MSVAALIAKMEIQNRNAYLEAENNRLNERNAYLEYENNENVKKNSDLKTDLEEAQEYYDDYSALWNKMVDQRDDEIERLTMVCSNIKHGKNAQIVALDKTVDTLKTELDDVKTELDDVKTELAEEKAYTEKSLTYANAAEQQLIMENYQLKTRIDVLTEMYESQSAAVAAFNDMKKKLAEQTAMLASVSAKLIAVQDAVLYSSTYMAQVIATNKD